MPSPYPDGFAYTPEISRQIWLRIRVAVAAYSYEYLAHSLISDAEFDALCQEIDVSIDTQRPDLDEWFRREFHPDTGQWVHAHPEKAKLQFIAERMIIDQTSSAPKKAVARRVKAKAKLQKAQDVNQPTTS